MEHKIFDLFPTPVIKFKLDREFTNAENEFFKKIKNNTIKNYGNSNSVDTYILEKDEMQNIKDFCQSATDIYFNKIYCPVDEKKNSLVITQSWLNYTNKQQFHHSHTHPNSIVSGVFYINADKKLDEIILNKPDLHMQFEITPKAKNDYNTYEVTFKVGKYELILFPSHMYHRVPLVESNETRISLAFNTFFRGTLGDLRGLTELKL
jgi:uncharacterized protein (TIGR02466 family)